MKKHLLLLLFCAVCTGAASAQSRDGGKTSATPNLFTSNQSKDSADFMKEMADVVNGLSEEDMKGWTSPAAVAVAKPAPAGASTGGTKPGAGGMEDSKQPEEILGELMDAASRGELERYKGAAAEPITNDAGSRMLTWTSRAQFPGAAETMCYYKNSGTLVVSGIYGDESSASAAKRASTLNATLKSLMEQKGGYLSSDNSGDAVVYVLGKGAMYVELHTTETAGVEYVAIFAQHLDK